MYRDLAQQIAAAMRTGSLRVGDRIPSVRRLSKQHSVSVSTAVQALRYLENQRLIEARPKSGFFVSRQPQDLAEPEQSKPPRSARYVVTPSLQREYIEAFSAPEAVPLGAVVPPSSMFPGDRLARLVAATARRNPALTVTYPVYSPGAEDLRRVIARRALDSGVRIAADDVIVTAGALEAVMLALRAVARPGDTIALESPTHFMLLQAIEGLGMKALEIPTHPRSGLSIDALDLASQRGAVRALLLVPTFSNPLGATIPDEHRKRLVHLCAEREIPVIENDVFGEVTFEEPRPRPLKSWDKTGNVLLCSSFSKTIAPGLRIGWLVPGRYQQQVEMLRLAGFTFAPHIPQLALAQFIANGGYDLHLRKLRSALREQAGRLRETVAASFPAESRVTKPRGGYVLWVELPARIDAVELFRRAHAENITLAPGPLFTSTDRFRNCIRLSFAHNWSRTIEDAVARVGRLARELETR
ncbi:MAG TPA: PLP-dependent aminotransferase family protein [Steroidobacteraceae bacterium]|nr:PLP-dependent aminotransferase family protein [Steroidobacteraceae bacterium]